jgi:hypothetical protein
MEMLAISVSTNGIALDFGKDTNHDSLFTLESQISHVTFASGIAVPEPRYLIASHIFVTHF